MTTWFTTSRISDNLETTPEGFVLARNVPVARTGAQLYRHNELPDLQANGDGWLSVDREPGEVFRDDSIASFTGKPITNDHPFDIVTPDNWSKLAIGVVQNARRGSGANSDVLVADLLFTTQRGIDLIKRGKRSLSVGYDASYEQKAPGMARQRDIIVNHVALVDEGRCGVRCTIVDGAPILVDTPIAQYDAKPVTPRPRRRKNLVTVWFDRKAIWRMEDNFVEAEHPRDDEGKFSEAAGGAATGKERGGKGKATAGHLPTTTGTNGERRGHDGGPLPAHIQAAKIPKPWTNVTYHPDPGASLLAVGRDEAGRRQSIYSSASKASKAAEKYQRVEELGKAFADIHSKNEAARKSGSHAADALALVMHTGIRPGGDADTGAKEDSYGATNLEGRHVSADGKTLTFVPGKKGGKSITMAVDDPEIASMLKKRKAAAGDSGRLFQVNAKQLLKHTQELGGGFKTKDFRTHIGTQTALAAMAKIPAPKNPQQYKAAVSKVAKRVSDKLGNTPKIALTSYIAPQIFAEWKQASGATKDQAPDDDGETPEQMPQCHWGYVGAPPHEFPEDDADDDGEDVTSADPSIIDMLGFDPFEIPDDFDG